VGTKERRVREKKQLRRKILDAARELFVAEGYDNVSMRKVAQRIEYSPTTIYLYFKDKTDLLLAISQDTLETLVRTLEALAAKVEDPVETFAEFGRTYIKFGLEYPHDYELAFTIRPRHQEGLGLPEDSTSKRAFDAMSAIVEQCIGQGKFRPVDAATAGQAMWTAVHGVTSLLIAYPEFPWVQRDKLIAHVLDTMVAGLRA